MVVRFVFLKLHDEHLSQRDQLAAVSEQRLPEVPGVRQARALLPADPKSAASWDLCLQVSFDDMAAVDAYVPHPVHRAFVTEVLDPVVACKKAWNFQA